jgi:hypothetical protein
VSDLVVLALAAVIVACPSFTWYVAGRLGFAARPEPREPFLTVVWFATLGIAISSTIGAALGIHALVFAGTGGVVRLLPQGVAVYLIAAALIIVSLFEIPLVGYLTTLGRPKAYIHKRDEDPAPTFHRRASDTVVDVKAEEVE